MPSLDSCCMPSNFKIYLHIEILNSIYRYNLKYNQFENIIVFHQNEIAVYNSLIKFCQKPSKKDQYGLEKKPSQKIVFFWKMSE